ncbi:MAG: hypothetical protein Q8P72_02870 [Candidatus Roizmanbacteria bacterium]|nr:hypothetical protein [Candidatus Roizmanbacteria bacterium]
MLSKNDLSQIRILLDERLEVKLEQKFKERLEPLEERLSSQIQALSDQVVEYVDILHTDHEKRINKLEEKPAYIISDK